ncbi:MAG: hypothetical protein ACLPSL_14540 [Smithella sp.]
MGVVKKQIKQSQGSGMIKSVTVANDFTALDENVSCMKKKDEFVLQLHNETLTKTDVFRFDETLYLAAKTL